MGQVLRVSIGRRPDRQLRNLFVQRKQAVQQHQHPVV